VFWWADISWVHTSLTSTTACSTPLSCLKLRSAAWVERCNAELLGDCEQTYEGEHCAPNLLRRTLLALCPTWMGCVCTLRNNASANALVNVDSRTYCVHKLAYYRHDMATYITLFCLQVQLLCCAPMHSFALLICCYLLTHTQCGHKLLLLWHYWHSSMIAAYTAISVNKCGPAKFVALLRDSTFGGR